MRLAHQLALIGSSQFGISGSWDCHVYALEGPEGLVLIDSGGGAHTERLVKNLAMDLGREAVRAVLVTHAHADHVGGAASFREQTHCQILAPEMSRTFIEKGDEEATGLRKGREAGCIPFQFSLAAV